jgi:3-isopropylmalate/(R)-2-methylmalate dehydratase small subunit
VRIIRGRVWKFGDDINTDLMYPGIVLRKPEEAHRYVFYANRPGWVDQVWPGDIIVAGRNFGTGSSRPAPLSLRRLGIGAVVADSINGLFFRNCVNFGLPAVEAPGASALFEEGEIAELDLGEGLVTNLRTGGQVRGRRLPERLLEILEAGGIIPVLIREGYLEDTPDEGQPGYLRGG